MPIQVTCPHCAKTISAPEKFAGKMASCPACKNPIQVPAADDDMSVPDFSQPQTVEVGPAKVAVEPVAKPASPYASPKSSASSDRSEPQRVKIVGIRVPFVDVLILTLQSFAVGFVIWIVVMIIFTLLAAAIGPFPMMP
jgi:hypothetical protein